MRREATIEGVRAILPAIPPNIAFGLLFGATAVEVGFTPLQVTAMSLFMFAGTAQMAAIELLRVEAAFSVVLATVLVLNLRYVVYSASLAPQVQHLSSRWRALMGYALSDINYALAHFRFRSKDEDNPDAAPVHEGWYYVGLTFPFVVSFVLATAVGGLVGATIGDGWHLEFAIPLIFIAILIPSIKNSTTLIIAIVSGSVAIVGIGIPFNLGLLVATGCGVTAGILFDRTIGEAVGIA